MIGPVARFHGGFAATRYPRQLALKSPVLASEYWPSQFVRDNQSIINVDEVIVVEPQIFESLLPKFW